jgi:hypothetical protein
MELFRVTSGSFLGRWVIEKWGYALILEWWRRVAPGIGAHGYVHPIADGDWAVDLTVMMWRRDLRSQFVNHNPGFRYRQGE